MFKAFFLNARISLPLALPVLIIHFEGLVGMFKEYTNNYVPHYNTNSAEQFKYILRNDLKKQMRRLSKHFIIIYIFESNDLAHRSFINHIIK
jgi:hypothetical protein